MKLHEIKKIIQKIADSKAQKRGKVRMSQAYSKEQKFEPIESEITK